VVSLVPELDPIAACVGPKGRHAQAIVAALGGERLDILSWSDVPQSFVKWALAPASVQTVQLDLNHQRAVAFVSPAQVQLAHGRDDENRALASELTGWTIEILTTDAA
jgi:N utilization substance protein A